MIYLEMILLLVGAHFICDYVLQPEKIALGKNRRIQKARHGVDWRYWLTAHASTHAVAVVIVTGSIWLGLLEFALHWLIDFCKCESLYSLHIDQALHIACKVLIVLLFFILG